MDKKKRLLIIDIIFSKKGIGYPFAAMNDLNLLMLMGGKLRTLSEWEELLKKASFEIVNITSFNRKISQFSIIETRIA